jgi:hypothetical protein
MVLLFFAEGDDIWFTGYKYVESANFVLRCSSILLWGRWLNLY